MGFLNNVAILILAILSALIQIASADYVGAVAEHTVYQGTDSETSESKLSKNIGIYEDLIALSASLGVQVLVFPEFGLTPASAEQRSNLYPYIEVIPESSENLIPCTNSSFSSRPILQRMSCAALKYKQLILVNMIDNVSCNSSTDFSCPSDGHYHFNTDVIFDDSGALVAKYHKSHEFPPFLIAYDQPDKPSRVTYKSSFGVEFGLFICYDILFPDPAKVLRQKGIEHFLYSVAQTKVGEKLLIEPWSRNNSATVLSSNLGSGHADCSGLIVNGAALPAKKHYLSRKRADFPTDNLLVATVPTMLRIANIV